MTGLGAAWVTVKRHDTRDRQETGTFTVVKKLWAIIFFKYSSVAQYFDDTNVLNTGMARWH